MGESTQGWIIAALGTYALLALFLNWDWFYDNYQTRRVVALIGRSGTRVLFLCTGLLIIVLGL